ncbi:MAG: hypothetical protein AAFN07_12100 [Pseudomonadota bacterium]
MLRCEKTSNWRLLGASLLLLHAAGCVSEPHVDPLGPPAVVTSITEEACDRPAVRLDEIRNTQTGELVELTSRYGPIAVPAGRYEISVACQNPLDTVSNECVFYGHPNEYPTYVTGLANGVTYSFRCFVDAGRMSYRLVESDP